MFDFDSNKGFTENLTRFLEHAESLDPTLGPIFKEFAAELVKRDGQDRTSARSAFNSKVLNRLDALPKEKPE